MTSPFFVSLQTARHADLSGNRRPYCNSESWFSHSLGQSRSIDDDVKPGMSLSRIGERYQAIVGQELSFPRKCPIA